MSEHQIVDHLTAVNHWTGRDGHQVRGIVLHITDGATAAGAIAWFHNPASEVSAHYVIDRDGSITRIVAEADAAWANGRLDRPDMAHPLVARWVNRSLNPNLETVSIEAAGRSAAGWTDAQVVAARWLVGDIAGRHGLVVSRDTVIGHYQLDSMTRARCPSLLSTQWSAIVGHARDQVGVDQALEREYQREQAMLGEKRFAAEIIRPGFAGTVLVCERGVVASDPATTEHVRAILMDDLVTYLEASNVLRRLV